MSTMTVQAQVRLPGLRESGVPERTVRECRVRERRVREQGGGVRLTRRARLLLTGLTLLVTVALAVLATGGGPATAVLPGAGGAAPSQQVTVRPGQTLWAIAERAAPGVDPRETVAEIMDLNALESSAVQAGQVLLLP